MSISAREPFPPSPPADQYRRGPAALLKTLAEDGATLVRQEIRLARLEIATAVRAVGVGTVLVTLGTMMALLGALAAITAIVLLAGDQWLRDRYWLAALVVAVVAGAAAAFAVARGKDKLEPEQLRPDETTESLKENTAWLKRQLTSAGTSK
jgi:ABC-type Fe3+-siderophore transport system permease subunit